MKINDTNRAITAFLVLALLILPFQHPARAQTRPKTVVEFCVALVVIGVGVVVVSGLCKLAKKIPPAQEPPDPPDGPSTNNPAGSNNVQIAESNVTLETVNNDANLYDISAAGYSDPDGNPFALMYSYHLQSSTNLMDWKDECSVTGWCSYGWSVAVAYCSNQPVCTNWSQTKTNAVNVSIHRADRMFFRQVTP